MLQNIKQVHKRIAAEEGATVVEYGVVVALIIGACIAIIFILGVQVQGGFENFSQSLNDAGVNPPATNP